MASGMQGGEHSIDVVRLEGDMMQPGTASGNKPSNGVLVLFGVPAAAILRLSSVGRVKILQEFEFAIARGDKGNPLPADDIRCPIVLDDAFLRTNRKSQPS